MDRELEHREEEIQNLICDRVGEERGPADPG